MRKIAYPLVLAFIVVGLFLIFDKRPHDISVLPIPVSICAGSDTFQLTESTGFVSDGSDETAKIIDGLKSEFSNRTKLDFIQPQQDGLNISFNLDKEFSPANEAYKLSVTKKQISITASSPAGLFYGGRTLSQLLVMKGNKWQFPACIIEDSPRFSYRGVMLDVARHFFTVEDVKKFIDLISDLKINTLHLHLTDDQGWRIEIKSWPELTAVGAACQVGEGEGGFYTQEEFKEIVNYAASKYVEIIPEIDMPGHTNAVLASYPELTVDGVKKEPYRGIKVGISTLDTRKEITYRFVDDVVREISALYPGEYFHIGGDESTVTKMEDYIYFINRVKRIVNKYGKKCIGWEEVVTADNISSEDIIQAWVKKEYIDQSVSKGAKVLLSPAKYVYLDMQYDSTSRIGQNWAGYIDVDVAYNWDPIDVAEVKCDDYIIGIESPLWTETVERFDDIEYLVFPRLAGHAEIGWSPREKRDWKGYSRRLARYAIRFKDADVDFYQSKLIDWE